jgi:hypothetical protein
MTKVNETDKKFKGIQSLNLLSLSFSFFSLSFSTETHVQPSSIHKILFLSFRRKNVLPLELRYVPFKKIEDFIFSNVDLLLIQV